MDCVAATGAGDDFADDAAEEAVFFDGCEGLAVEYFCYVFCEALDQLLRGVQI